MKKFFLLFFMACCVHLMPYAQTTDEEVIATDDSTSSESYDTAVATPADPFIIPVPRTLSQDSAAALQKDKAFEYMKYIDSVFRNKSVPEPQPERISTTEAPGIFDNRGLRTAYWLLAMAAVAFIAFRMFAGSGSFFTFNKKLALVKQQQQHNDEIPQKPEDLLTQAIKDKNYRLATRYLYLQTLKLLGEKDALLIAPQKTNYQYVQEIKDKALQQKFAVLTLHYEYAWFGNFALSEKQFDTIEQEFKSFKNILA